MLNVWPSITKCWLPNLMLYRRSNYYFITFQLLLKDASSTWYIWTFLSKTCVPTKFRCQLEAFSKWGLWRAEVCKCFSWLTCLAGHREMSVLFSSHSWHLMTFLQGYMLDRCSGVVFFPSHQPDWPHKANYSHRQLMTPASNAYGNGSIMWQINIKSMTFGNINLQGEMRLR